MTKPQSPWGVPRTPKAAVKANATRDKVVKAAHLKRAAHEAEAAAWIVEVKQRPAKPVLCPKCPVAIVSDEPCYAKVDGEWTPIATRHSERDKC